MVRRFLSKSRSRVL